MEDEWIMEVTYPDGKKKRYKGIRTLPQMLEGAKEFAIKEGERLKIEAGSHNQ